LKVVLSELRVFGAYGNLTAKIHSDFGDNPVSAFARVLERLENDPAYSPIDPERAVPMLFGLLAHARRGLSVDELTSLFIQALGLEETEEWREAAADTVNLFLRQVRSFLSRREGRYDFFFESFKIGAQQCYVGKGDEETISKRSYQEWHRFLANYFGGLPTWQEATPSSQGQLARQPTRRKVAELPHHLIQAEQWEGLEETLCDLDFIEAKCAAGMTFDLVTDYHLALDSLPEAQEGLNERRTYEERAARWTRALIQYSQAWSERRDRISRGQPVDETEPVLPEIPASCRMWTDEEIANECQRIMENPTRLDRLTAFSGFVSAECYPLLQFGHREGFVLQHAWNHAPGGPVHAAAAGMLPNCGSPVLLRRWPSDAVYNPKPALLSTLEGHGGPVESVSVTPDGRCAISGSVDNTLRVWDVESGACLRTLEGHSGPVESVSVTPDGRRAVSGAPYGLRVWDLEGGACLRTLRSDWVRSVSVTPDGWRAVSCAHKSLQVWDLESGACLSTLEGHSDWVSSVSMTPDGRRAVSGSTDGTLRVWDVESGACLRALEGHSGWVSSVSMTPDGRHAVSGGSDKTVRVWDLESGACLRTLEGHRNSVFSVSMTPDGRRAVSVGDKTLRVWDLESGACARTLEARSYSVKSVSLTLDGRRAVLGADDSLQVWDVESGGCLRTLEGRSAEVRSVSLTPDGRRAVSGSVDNTLRVWDLESGACLRTLEGHTDKVWSVSVMPDGGRAVSASNGTGASLGRQDENNLRIWDLESGACLRTLQGHSAGVTSVSVTPDGRRAVSVGFDWTLRVWDLESGACLRTLEGHRNSVFAVSVTTDGRRAVSGGADNTLRVWDVESGVCLHTFEGHSDTVESVSVTPDGLRAVSGSDDGTLRVWDVESGACLRTLEGHSGWVSSVSVTPDGRRVVSGCKDNTLRLWDLESVRCLGVYAAPADVVSVALADGGNTICAGTQGGEVLFLDVLDIEPGPDLKPDPSDEGYEQLLRRGLEFTRREKGNAHEETLAHLSALAAHLERMGKSDEALRFAQERDQLASRIAARNAGDTE
jgi:WD40 repeat protein